MPRGLLVIPSLFIVVIAGIVALRAGERPMKKNPPPAPPTATAKAPATRPTTLPVTGPVPEHAIEFQTWAGYHDGKPRRLNVADVLMVTAHVALGRHPDGSQMKVEGSRIETRDGAWYATDAPDDLIARLAKAGWVAPPPRPATASGSRPVNSASTRPAHPAATRPKRAAVPPVAPPVVAPADGPAAPPGTIVLQPWPGFRDGKPKRIRVQDVRSVTEYAANEPPRPPEPARRVTGSKVATTAGVLYTAEPPAALLARLQRLGWVAPQPTSRPR